MQQWLKEVARGKRGSKDLSYNETLEVARSIIHGHATDAQIAAYFIAERLKTESPDELLAFVHAYQAHSEKLLLSPTITDHIIDFAGPYNGRNTFAATIPASILMADHGIPAFLHGSDSLPPKYGLPIMDILLELGVDIDSSKANLSQSIEDCLIGFAWTERYNHSLGELRSIREQIGVRTLMNTVEKLLNLSQAKSLMMGAFHRTAINKIYPIFQQLSYQNVFIVQGLEGSEDVPVHRNSFVFQLTEDSLDSFIVKPEEYGLLNKDFDKNEKLTAEEQRDITLAVLSGDKSPTYRYYYNQVVFNTGIRYYLFGATKTIEEGIDVAKEQIQKQSGLRMLEKWKQRQLLIKDAN
ncbi:anthranilate phosphoribosyltransferase [Aquibacillus koreensis]|uniref:Anthranilate phosphoribosyltransferase n=1 Tax=Aquibacillus koreensis TaxID=279446 RepID=A0A9X3WJ97_9BACI|nr:anthranilate phosphoribosyltransferase [Aquibacillus koreensis]MCT2534230.1 anthranilate phosphoribosyltransferase [Aquibacillus koreensis]MDC3420725.1 anthranilate phosphoribosyltransferase [Aquibacillus koreensis]